jgi:hypothetical protein
MVVFSGSKYFSQNLKTNSKRPLGTHHRFQETRGLWGDFFELFSLGTVRSGFSQDHCAENLTNVKSLQIK